MDTNCAYDVITRDSELHGGHRVYMIADAVMGYLNDTDAGRVFWCSTCVGAKKYDSMRDITARVAALDMSSYLNQRGYKTEVRRFKRHELYPEEY